MQRLLAILLIIALFTSCEKEVQLGVADNFSQLVVIGHFNPDTVFSVFVSATTSATDPINPGFFPNAEVSIFEEGTFIEDLIISPENAFYQAQNSRPVPGKSYEVRVGFPGNPNRAIGVSSVPQPVPVLSTWISDIEKRRIDNFSAGVEYTITLEIILDNSTDVNPYTHLEFLRDSIVFEVIGTDTILINTHQQKRLEVLTTPNDLPYLVHFDFGALTSGKGNDQSELKYTFQLRTQIDTLKEAIPEIYLNARNVSEDYYLYHTTLTRQLRQSTDTLFQNPVIVYDNITNGAGIFAGYNNSFDTIPVR